MACKRSAVRSRVAPPNSDCPVVGVQLSWESICFASRGSAVRSRLPPPFSIHLFLRVIFAFIDTLSFKHIISVLLNLGLQLSWESACMACKRSAVRSRVAPPNSDCPVVGVQLSWESICFASRGSAVRSRLPPPILLKYRCGGIAQSGECLNRIQEAAVRSRLPPPSSGS